MGAAMGGHLEVLQWVRANGCPVSRQTRNMAHSRGWPVHDVEFSDDDDFSDDEED